MMNTGVKMIQRRCLSVYNRHRWNRHAVCARCGKVRNTKAHSDFKVSVVTRRHK